MEAKVFSNHRFPEYMIHRIRYCATDRAQSAPPPLPPRIRLPANHLLRGKVYVRGTINFKKVIIMVDSGSPFNLISAKTVNDLRIPINDMIRFTLCGVGDNVITTLGRVVLPVYIGTGNTYMCRLTMDVVDDPSFNILYGSHDLLRLKHIIDYESEVLRLGGGRTTTFMTKQEYINETGYESPLGAVGPIHQFLASLNEIVPEDPELIDDNEEGESSVISWAVETSGVGVLKIGCLMSQNNYLYETLDELINSFDTMESRPISAWNCDNLNELVELSVSNASDHALAVATKLGEDLKKHVILVKDCSFILRCFCSLLDEVLCLLKEDFSPEQLDKTTAEFGFNVGLATLADQIGLDVGENSPSQTPELLELINAGIKGKKSGAGIYVYSGGEKKSKKVPNAKAKEILARYKLKGSKPSSLDHDQQMRIILRIVNEALLCLEKGIIASPSDGDVASVSGLGFPSFLGGPFRFVDLYGAQELVNQMELYQDKYDVKFKPCKLLSDYAKSGQFFYSK